MIFFWQNPINKLLKKYPDYWLEIARNPISGKWVVRIASKPSSNHQDPNNIYLEVGDTLKSTIKKLL